MRRVIVLAAASLSLAGCASFSMDGFKSSPVPVTVQFDSVPPGADVVTSVGPGCKTPCSLPIATETGFTATFNLAKYQPVTVPVTVTKVPGDFTTAATTVVDPSPVVAELQPMTPPRRAARKAAKKRAAPAPAAAAPAEGSPFPAPAR
ncbi:hypothetical protein FNL55_11910 [Tardiphaga sp. vice352]|uniref:hypothetical protein n=1 Tax=unclassified Tardiphaga TaxID=2631404 RepID=UPI0011631CFA|nr:MULTISPECIES: hypothetical protein [unclassified Tardiphaga]QDM16671.1 hypothetical protein FNL53_12620 [Tardiphaga sp. vice278]QDM21694.1 hypothetical protein FIU28_11490 [Tardiphaga sp. vice154]QDM26877.1 hypothetical protein FNL56_12770 [Tardiphaga sp. vice304]QDM31946.1 hypothetical protein FNL55_11910 [Tardiphaga sp. vice352]